LSISLSKYFTLILSSMAKNLEFKISGLISFTNIQISKLMEKTLKKRRKKYFASSFGELRALSSYICLNICFKYSKIPDERQTTTNISRLRQISLNRDKYLSFETNISRLNI
jgi:hypothetical protein